MEPGRIQRYRLTLAYRGTRYHGWQVQPALPSWHGAPPAAGEGLPTIQRELRAALGAVVGHPVNCVGSSRTDSGVHAKGQVVHFDTDQAQIPPDGLRRAANSRLPEDIVIQSIAPAPPTFDAIRSTLCKRYQYFIWNAPDRSVFTHDLAWHRWRPMDLQAMRQAAAHLVGEHDFVSFAKPGHGRASTVRRVEECSVSRRGGMVVFGVCGGGFLWQMVRIIVGTLAEVGQGLRTPDDVKRMLEARDRVKAGPTAPAHGLYLQWVKFRPEAAGDPILPSDELSDLE